MDCNIVDILRSGIHREGDGKSQHVLFVGAFCMEAPQASEDVALLQHVGMLPVIHRRSSDRCTGEVPLHQSLPHIAILTSISEPPAGGAGAGAFCTVFFPFFPIANHSSSTTGVAISSAGT